jgi:alkanesulfonate monooxygenase SsuD/methylene tetrahydromethanopterin reductase-like flavin-dependent oxidoreductase (luciferase family)
MGGPRLFYLCAQEQFPPEDCLRQAVAAERAGFDGVGCSDHLQPWWEPGESGHAWVWLGAAGQATARVALGTAVTPGEIVLQLQFSWAPSDEQALDGARVWKGAQPSEFYTDDWHRPREMYEHGEQQVSDDQLREKIAISSNPEVHTQRLREVAELGATIVAAMNVSGTDPHGAIETYARDVLSALRAVGAARS